MARKRRGFRKRSREEWAAIVAEYRASGLTQQAFAESAGVTVSSLARWLQTFRMEAESEGLDPECGGWVDLVRQKPSAQPQIMAEPTRLLVGGGVWLELWELPPPEYIALVARAYEASAPC